MTLEKRFHLTADEWQFFDDNGYLGPFTLYSPDEMKAIYRKVRAQLFNRKFAAYDLPLDSSVVNYDRHLDVSKLSEHICRREIVDRVSGILGRDVVCWRSEFLPKQPGAEGTDWHQADTFEHASGEPQLVWPDDGAIGGTINVWTAFTEATVANGCLLLVPGTHKEMKYDESKGMVYDPGRNADLIKNNVKRGFIGYDYRDLQKDPDWVPDESRAVAMVMQPGQFIIFRSTLLHASHPNTTTDSPRLGYVCRYVPSRVKVYPDTDVVREFGGEFSLENYGVVVVSGDNVEPTNRVRTRNMRGEEFTAAP